jgi:hypothetical protein
VRVYDAPAVTFMGIGCGKDAEKISRGGYAQSILPEKVKKERGGYAQDALPSLQQTH